MTLKGGRASSSPASLPSLRCTALKECTLTSFASPFSVSVYHWNEVIIPWAAEGGCPAAIAMPQLGDACCCSPKLLGRQHNFQSPQINDFFLKEQQQQQQRCLASDSSWNIAWPSWQFTEELSPFVKPGAEAFRQRQLGCLSKQTEDLAPGTT